MSKSHLLLLPFLIVGIFSPDSNDALAYDNQTTHPALTDEIADFYNLSSPNDPISPEEKEWMIEGSRLEDTPPRWINHFYDPINKVGWTGEEAGRVWKEAVRVGADMVFGTPLSAVDWATDDMTQQTFAWFGGNRSWKQGLEYLAKGERREAFITLGHILHLLEDMSVPDHTRNDTHAQAVSAITGDDGSPYESYATRWTRDTIFRLQMPESFIAQSVPIPNRSKIQDYLIAMAEYSNKYFFSKDTINDPKYQFPKVVKTDQNIGYGVDEMSAITPLVLLDKRWNKEKNEFSETFLLAKNEPTYTPILDSYFIHLARQVILNGAGVINLFKRETEDTKVNLEVWGHALPFQSGVAKPVSKAVLSVNFLPGGIAGKIVDFVEIQSAAVSQAAKAATAKLGGLLGLSPATTPPPATSLSDSDIQSMQDKLTALNGRRLSSALLANMPITPQSSPETSKITPPLTGRTNDKEVEQNTEEKIKPPPIPASKSPQPPKTEPPPEPPLAISSSSQFESIPHSAPIIALVRDGTSPSRVTDLHVSTTTTSSVVLAWTAPGDDHDSGQAYEYIIKFSTSTLSTSNWSAASQVVSAPPRPAGRNESLIIFGLQPDTTYHFGLITRDESPNDSELSNIAFGATLAEGPSLAGFSAAYSSSTMSAEFRWNLVPNPPSSTYTYRLLDITTSSPGISIFTTTSTTSTSVAMDSERNFEFRIEDETGIRAVTTTVVSSTFYSYLGTIVPRNATTATRQAGNTSGNYWWAQSFRPQRTGLVNRVRTAWAGPIVSMGGLEDCSFGLYAASSPAEANTSTQIGGFPGGDPEGTWHGAGCVGGDYAFSSSTIQAGSDYTLVFRYRDASHVPGLWVGSDSLPGSWWQDGTEYPEVDANLELAGIVMSEQRFSAAPSAPSDLQAVFDASHGSLSLSWSASNDPDSSSALIRYQVNVSTSTLDDSGWRSIGSSLSTSTHISTLATYQIGVRARDEYGHMSSSTQTSWTPPADLSFSDELAAQTDQNHVVGANAQDGTRTNTYAQTFTVASSGTPYSIRIATGGSWVGNCSLKIYRADDMAQASPAGLIASSDDLSGSACNASNPKTFELTSTGPLSPGNTYIWIYTIANSGALADSIVGGLRPEGGYFGTFSAAVNGTVIFNSDSTQSAYFELLGDLTL